MSLGEVSLEAFLEQVIIGDWNAKVGSQETSGVTGKFGLGLQNEAGQRLEFCQENVLIIANTLFQQHKRMCLWEREEHNKNTAKMITAKVCCTFVLCWAQ